MPQAATPQIVQTVGPYKFLSCYTEGTNVRALGSASTAGSTMTVQSCEAFCNGYTYFGVEYGQECYCGNSFGNGSVPAPNTDCNMVCAGNGGEYCGAGNRLLVYSDS